MEKITFESFKDHKGENPEFDNPHGWTQEELSEAYLVICEKFSMAWNIKLMALSYHVKKGPASEEIESLKSTAPRGFA